MSKKPLNLLGKYSPKVLNIKGSIIPTLKPRIILDNKKINKLKIIVDIKYVIHITTENNFIILALPYFSDKKLAKPEPMAKPMNKMPAIVSVIKSEALKYFFVGIIIKLKIFVTNPFAMKQTKIDIVIKIGYFVK